MAKENANKVIIEKLQSMVADGVVIDWIKAQELAEEYGTKARSIVQICNRNNIAYQKKARVSKTGKPIARKAELVAAIAEKHGVDVAALDGLEKASKSSLEILAGI